MKTYFLILFLFVSAVSFGQRNSQSTELVDEIALSFERNSDSILAKGGLKIVSIRSRDTLFYTDDGYPILYQSDRAPLDTLISFFETDTSLRVNFVVYEASSPSSFGWISQIYFDKETLTIRCEYPGQPMSVPPWWSPFSVAVEFQKTRPGKFETIRINEIDYTLDKFTNQR